MTHDYLDFLVDKYNFLNILIPVINTRYDRMIFERIVACILQMENTTNCIFGDLFHYFKEDAFKKKLSDLSYTNLPFLKIWSGR